MTTTKQIKGRNKSSKSRQVAVRVVILSAERMSTGNKLSLFQPKIINNNSNKLLKKEKKHKPGSKILK